MYSLVLPTSLLIAITLSEGGEGWDGNGGQDGAARCTAFMSSCTLFDIKIVVVGDGGGDGWCGLRAHFDGILVAIVGCATRPSTACADGGFLIVGCGMGWTRTCEGK